jgi:hypothetical protein
LSASPPAAPHEEGAVLRLDAAGQVGRGAQHRSGSALAPPANFAEETDSRYAAYVEQCEECWELDALSPTVTADLIRTEIEAMIDVAKWRKEAAEQHNRALLDRVTKNWAKVRWCASVPLLTDDSQIGANLRVCADEEDRADIDQHS